MNTSYEFIAAPPIVSESNWLTQERTYWPKMEDGHYVRMSDHQIRSYARKRGRKGNDLIYEAVFGEERRPEKVRCVAGLQPGIYREYGKTFLNPAFVPLVKLSATPDPSDEFVVLCDRLTRLMGENKPKEDLHKRWQISEQIRAAETRLIEIYEETREVKRVGGLYAHPWRLLNMSRHLGEFPDDDHCQLFRGRRGFIWTSQPYGLSRAEIIGFANLHQLEVTVSPKWSWHYPGHSLLIEWARK